MPSRAACRRQTLGVKLLKICVWRTPTPLPLTYVALSLLAFAPASRPLGAASRRRPSAQHLRVMAVLRCWSARFGLPDGLFRPAKWAVLARGPQAADLQLVAPEYVPRALRFLFLRGKAAGGLPALGNFRRGIE